MRSLQETLRKARESGRKFLTGNELRPPQVEGGRDLYICNGLRRKIWLFSETIATLPGGWDLAHAISLGIKPFAELGANSEALSGSQVDSPRSCRAIFESAPVAMLQSLFSGDLLAFGAAAVGTIPILRRQGSRSGFPA